MEIEEDSLIDKEVIKGYRGYPAFCHIALFEGRKSVVDCPLDVHSLISIGGCAACPLYFSDWIKMVLEEKKKRKNRFTVLVITHGGKDA